MNTTDIKIREELNALSTEVFGSSSKWQKLVNKGYLKFVTETVKELVPADSASAENQELKEIEVQKPVLLNGIKQSVMVRHTVESVRELMLEMKVKREAFFAELKKQQEDKDAAKAQAELAKKVQDQLAGATGV